MYVLELQWKNVNLPLIANYPHIYVVEPKGRNQTEGMWLDEDGAVPKGNCRGHRLYDITQGPKKAWSYPIHMHMSFLIKW